MNLAYKYPIIFWDCACLIVNSGGEAKNEDSDEAASSKDYNKIAQALGKAAESGVKILPPNVNKSDFTFTPDPENNSILYGLSGINKIGLDIVPKIIAGRPYKSLADFQARTTLNRAQIIELIKAGAFNDFNTQSRNMVEFIWTTCDKKKRLTLQNMPGLIKYNLIPNEESLQLSRKVYEFNRYLKDRCKSNIPGNYQLDVRAINFLDSLGEEIDYGENFSISVKAWDKIYQKYMDVFRDWIADNKQDLLDKLNTAIFMQDWKDKASGTVSAWEMEAICYYHHPHELINVPKTKYGISDFTSLSYEPVIERTFKKSGREIPLFKIDKIAGTVIAKNKAKHTIYLLTTTGVVPVKFRKEYFLLFDKQISQKEQNGKKTVIEKSWFNRGNKLLIQGFRRENEFVARKYSATPGHTLYKIDEVLPDNSLILRNERAKGTEEDE